MARASGPRVIQVCSVIKPPLLTVASAPAMTALCEFSVNTVPQNGAETVPTQLGQFNVA